MGAESGEEDRVTWSQFWAMGGFGGYVWSAYAFTAFIVTVNTVAPLLRRRAVRRQLRRETERGEEGL